MSRLNIDPKLDDSAVLEVSESHLLSDTTFRDENVDRVTYTSDWGTYDLKGALGTKLRLKTRALTQTVQNNPLPFALGALALGFALSRLIPSAASSAKISFEGTQDVKDPSLHTGVHVRS